VVQLVHVDWMVLPWLVFVAVVASGCCGIVKIVRYDVRTIMLGGHGGFASQDYVIGWVALCMVIQN